MTEAQNEERYWGGRLVIRPDGVRKKHRARSKVDYAIRTGRISRPNQCEKCKTTCPPMKDGRASVQAHHCAGYDQPLKCSMALRQMSSRRRPPWLLRALETKHPPAIVPLSLSDRLTPLLIARGLSGAPIRASALWPLDGDAAE